MTSCAMRRAMLVFAAVGAVSMLELRSASADDAEEQKARAKKLFEAGHQAISKKDFVNGCAQMRESLELFVVANSLFQVAMCDEREMKFASALRHWKRGWALVDKTDPRSRVAAQKINELEKRVPRVRIVVPARVAPVVILIDDKEVSPEELEGPLPVDPGRHVLTVRKDGHHDKPFYVLVDDGQRTEVQVDVGPPTQRAPDKALEPEVSRNHRSSAFRSVAFIALGVGALGVVGTAVTSGLIVSNDATIDMKCADKSCDVETYDLVQEQRKLLPVNAAMWVTAGIGLSTATVFFILSRTSKTPARDTAVLPFVLPQGGGIGVWGRF